MAKLPQRSPADPLDRDLPAIVELIESFAGDPESYRPFRLRLREDALWCQLQAKRFHMAERIADGIAKFGGGSLLTTTLALIIGGQSGWPTAGVAGLTLLLFLSGTMLSAFFEYRSAAWDLEAERMLVALAETSERESHG